MIHIAIVDDDLHDRQLLREYLKTYEASHAEEFELFDFDDGETLVKDYRPAFDIILLDIEMEKMDGMTAAEHIREVLSRQTSGCPYSFLLSSYFSPFSTRRYILSSIGTAYS